MKFPISFLTNDMTANELKSLWDELKEGEAKAIGLLGSNNQSNSILICASTNEVDNFDCKEVMSLISKSYGGKGGGKGGGHHVVAVRGHDGVGREGRGHRLQRQRRRRRAD